MKEVNKHNLEILSVFNGIIRLIESEKKHGMYEPFIPFYLILVSFEICYFILQLFT